MQTIDLNQSLTTANVGVTDEPANQRVPLQATPPRPTFLQRFCQKTDQIFSEGNFFRLIAAAAVIASVLSAHVLTAIFAIIAGVLLWSKCKEADNTPLFNFSSCCQPNAAGS